MIRNIKQTTRTEQQKIVIQDERMKNQRYMIYSFMFGFLLILFFAIIVSKQYREKKKANQKLFAKNQAEKVDCNVLKIIATRSLESIYNYETIIHALSIIKEKGIQFQMSIVGKGSMKNELIRLSSDLGLSKLISFIGEDWDDEVLSYYTEDKSRNIKTPSYKSVMQPLYKSAMARWKRYEKHIEHVVPTLEPYIKEFGYE